MIAQQQQAVLDRLLDLVDRLYLESAGFLDKVEDQQLWYNRGYANGIIQQLNTMGYRDIVDDQIIADPVDILQGHEWMPWGKAYRHGVEVGSRETTEVIAPRLDEE